MIDIAGIQLPDAVVYAAYSISGKLPKPLKENEPYGYAIYEGPWKILGMCFGPSSGSTYEFKIKTFEKKLWRVVRYNGCNNFSVWCTGECGNHPSSEGENVYYRLEKFNNISMRNNRYDEQDIDNAAKTWARQCTDFFSVEYFRHKNGYGCTTDKKTYYRWKNGKKATNEIINLED